MHAFHAFSRVRGSRARGRRRGRMRRPDRPEVRCQGRPPGDADARDARPAATSSGWPSPRPWRGAPNGSVRLKLGDGYASALPANELRLARALEAGRADIGYLPARAWSAAGIPDVQGAARPVRGDDRRGCAGAGVEQDRARRARRRCPHDVVGLALVPAETRRVLADRPPLTPADFSGLRLRIVDDPQSAATFEALGAQAVQGLSARDVNRRAGDTIASTPPSRRPCTSLTNGYWNQLRHLSGYGVFPKFQSIVVSRRGLASACRTRSRRRCARPPRTRCGRRARSSPPRSVPT